MQNGFVASVNFLAIFYNIQVIFYNLSLYSISIDVTSVCNPILFSFECYDSHYYLG